MSDTFNEFYKDPTSDSPNGLNSPIDYMCGSVCVFFCFVLFFANDKCASNLYGPPSHSVN